MKHSDLLSVAVVFLSLISTRLISQDKAEHLFYYVDNEQCFAELRDHVDRVSIVAPAWFSADEDGVVWGSVDQRVLALAKKNGIGVMPLVVNPGFDQSLLHRLLVNDSARRRAINAFVELGRRHGLLGLQFDFENLNMNDKDAFTKFYRETADSLHKEGLKISVAVVHRPDELAGTTPYHKWLFKNWRAGYDLAELAKAGDFITVMTYSQHTRRTTPGPNAGIPWIRQVVEYFLKFMPPGKLSLGIPLQSQYWYTALDTAGFQPGAHSWSRALSYAEGMGMVDRNSVTVQWNDRQQVPFAVIENDGLFEYLYLEDARSFRSKLDVMNQFHLRGFSAWVLGAEDPAVWKALAPVSR